MKPKRRTGFVQVESGRASFKEKAMRFSVVRPAGATPVYGGGNARSRNSSRNCDAPGTRLPSTTGKLRMDGEAAREHGMARLSGLWRCCAGRRGRPGEDTCCRRSTAFGGLTARAAWNAGHIRRNRRCILTLALGIGSTTAFVFSCRIRTYCEAVTVRPSDASSRFTT